MTAVEHQHEQQPTDISSSGQTGSSTAVNITFSDLPSPDSGVELTSETSTPTDDTYKPKDPELVLSSRSASVQNGTAEVVVMTTTQEASSPPATLELSHEPAPPGHSSAVNSFVTNGPDELLPADHLWEVHRDQPVKLRMTEKGPGSEKPMSIPSMFLRTVKKDQNHIALTVKREGHWKQWTYRQYYDQSRQAAKSFIKLGLEPYHGVGIIGFNSPEWFISDMGAILAGGLAVGVYTTNSPEACHYVADNAQCNIIVVENDQQLQKILKVRDRLPHLRAIVQYMGKPKEKYPGVWAWDDFMQLSREVKDEVLDERIRRQAPNLACTLIYTSGTTGNPKGVMLSHDNLTWTALASGRASRFEFGKDRLVSYLPLSHIAAQLLDILFPMMFGATVFFAQPDALKGTLADTLKEARPTIFLGVPRVWEKMQEKITAIGRNSGAIKKKIAAWAKDIGYRGNIAMMNGRTTPFGWTLANAILFRKIKNALGLSQCRFCLTAAAPIMKETLDFFLSLDIPILELYGMSESSGPHTLSFPWKFRLGSVGSEFPGALTRLDDPDQDGNGEIQMGGRHVFMGYLNNEEKTIETFTDDGWLRTGDIGKKDGEFLHITGRIKELLITAGGENVAPVPLEDHIKEELPCVGNCMLIGDKRKFLSVLLTLKSEVDNETMHPRDKLMEAAVVWCKSLGSKSTTLAEILDGKDEKVLKAIQEGITRANGKAPSRAQTIQKWSILPKDFSIPGGELGPTMKLRRGIVSKMYTKTIDAFYEDK